MPLNRVNQVKALSFWLMVLNATNQEDGETDGSIATKRDGSSNLLLPGSAFSTEEETFAKKLAIMLFGTQQKITKYEINAKWWVPGMLIVTMPEAGVFLGYVDIGYWAGFLYVLGSVFYVMDSFFLWPSVYSGYSDDAFSAGVFLNLLAAWAFVVNALVCFLDWHTQVKQLSVMNMDINENNTGGFEINEINYNITWCYFFNNFFFLGAAVIYLIQGLWMESYSLDLEGCSQGFCGTFWINFWGSFLYVLSSAFAVAEYFEDKKIRKRQNAPDLYMFTTEWKRFDWFGWGDWLYLITSILAWGQTFFMFNESITDDDGSAFYLVVNMFFLLDSIAYFIGYLDFVLCLRQVLLTGTIPESHASTISELIGDNVNESIAERLTSSNPNERQSLLPIDRNGNVKIDDIHVMLREAKTIRARRSQAMVMRQTDVGVGSSRITQHVKDVRNPIRATFAAPTPDIELPGISRPVSQSQY